MTSTERIFQSGSKVRWQVFAAWGLLIACILLFGCGSGHLSDSEDKRLRKAAHQDYVKRMAEENAAIRQGLLQYRPSKPKRVKTEVN